MRPFTKSLFSVLAVLFLCLSLFSCGNDDDEVDEDIFDPTANCPIELNLDFEGLFCSADTFADTLNGFATIFYTGTNDRFAEGNFIDGVPEGFWKSYHENGNPWREGNYTNHRLHGFWKFYFENGNLRHEGHFEDCSREGFWKFYFENTPSAVEFEGNFLNNEPTGIWKRYDFNGRLMAECPVP